VKGKSPLSSWEGRGQGEGRQFLELTMNTETTKPAINPWFIAASVMIATFMEVLDTSIANVSLNHIAGSLSASYEEATWVLTSYLISNAIVIPSTAWLGQRFGRKRFLMFCLMIFTAASFLCGLSVSLPMLLFMRILQGAGGGALQPIAQAILMESFPQEKQGVAAGMYGLGVVLAPIIGPVLGGWITDNYSWRWIFYINVPFGLLALWMIQRYVEDPPWIKNAHPVRLDAIGFGFMSLWLGAQEILLDKGQEDDWFGSAFIIFTAVVAVVSFVIFIIYELKVDNPIVNLRLLKNRNFAVGVLLIFATGAMLYGLTATLPLFLQTLMGYTAFLSGVTMIPRGLGAFIAMPIAGRLVGKIQSKYLVAAGFITMGISSYVLSTITLDISPWILFWPLFFTGVSIGFIFVPLNAMALGALQREQMSSGSGIFNLMRNVGGSAGIAAVTTFVARQAQLHQAMLVEHLSPANPAYTKQLSGLQQYFSIHGGGSSAETLQKALQMLYGTLLRQSTLSAFMDILRWGGLFCFACLLLIILMRNVKTTANVPAH
jgi:MFS transporter, DHA2 family, multidrug resistance protein